MGLGGIFFLFVLVLSSNVEAIPDFHDAVRWIEVAKFMETEEDKSNYLPIITQRFPELTLPEAYEIQKYLSARSSTEKIIVGYKAGFTGLIDRNRFELLGPVSGVLFSGCGYKDGFSLSLKEHPGLMLELEIGFRLRNKITELIETVEDLKPYLSSGVPVIELPQIKFKDIEEVKGIDLVASNMASACWLEGKYLLNDVLDNYDVMKVALFRNGDLVDSGLGGAVGGQGKAILWLVKHLQKRKITLDEGLLLLTGKIGRINLAKEGSYVALYGDKKIVFQILP